MKTPRVNIRISLYGCNNHFKHWIEYSTCKSNWNYSTQSCCSSTNVCHLAVASVAEGSQPLDVSWYRQWKLFRHRNEPYYICFHHASVTSEADVFDPELPYQQSEVLGLLEMTEAMQATWWWLIQHASWRIVTWNVQEYVQPPAKTKFASLKVFSILYPHTDQNEYMVSLQYGITLMFQSVVQVVAMLCASSTTSIRTFANVKMNIWQTLYPSFGNFTDHLS